MCKPSTCESERVSRRKGFCSSKGAHSGERSSMHTKVLSVEKVNACRQRVGSVKYPALERRGSLLDNRSLRMGRKE